MRHRIGETDREGSDFNTESCRKSGKEISLIRTHVGSCLIVVGEINIKPLARHILSAKYKVPEKV